MKKNTALSLTVGVAVSAAALYFAFRNVPVSDLIDYMAGIDVVWILLSVIVILASFVVRALRWQVILGNARRIDFWTAFHPLMIGFMINCILPGRAGEIARPVILRQKAGVPFATGIATVAAERVFDILLLIGLFGLVLAMVDIDPDLDIPFGKYHLNKTTLLTIAGGLLKLGLVLIAGVATLSFEKSRRRINQLILAGPGLFFFAGDNARMWIRQKICTPVTSLIDNFASGFAQIKDPKTFLACTGLSVVVWFLAALSYYVISMGCPGIGLNFFEISAMMVIICFFIALPSVPGYWGIWEAGGIFGLYLFGVTAKDAAGFTLASHAVQILPVIVAGLVSAMVTGISIRGVSDRKPDAGPPSTRKQPKND